MNRFERDRFAADQFMRGEYEGWLADRVTPDDETGCWIWDLGSSHGIPKTRMPLVLPSLPRSVSRPRSVCARRVVWEMFTGKSVKPGQVAYRRIRCANCLCVNPDHILVGTPREASLAAAARGDFNWSEARKIRERLAARERQGKMTVEAIERIRRECAAAPMERGKRKASGKMATYKRLAAELGVSWQTVSAVACHRKYGDVGTETTSSIWRQLIASNDGRKAA